MPETQIGRISKRTKTRENSLRGHFPFIVRMFLTYLLT